MSVNFKIDTYIQPTLGVTWPNFWKSRSKI